MTVDEFAMAYKLDKEGVLRDFDGSYTKIYLFLNDLSVEDFMKVPSGIVNEVRSNSLKEMKLQREATLRKAEEQKEKNEALMKKRKDFNL